MEHWVLATIYVRDCKILLFDSLAMRRNWRRDCDDIGCLATRMILLAGRNNPNHSVQPPPISWDARPVIVSKVTLVEHPFI
jgi:hypothetical protein